MVPGARHRGLRQPAPRADRRAGHHGRALVAARAHRVRRRGARGGVELRPRPHDGHQPEDGVDRRLGDRRLPRHGRRSCSPPPTRRSADLVHIGPDTLLRGLAAALIGGMVSFPRAVVGAVADRHPRPGALLQLHRPRPGSCSSCCSSSVLVLVARVSRNDDRRGGESFPFAPRDRRRSRSGCASIWWVQRLPQLLAGARAARGGRPPAPRPTSRSATRPGPTIIAFALCAVSVVVLTGWGGQLSLGQMAFAGLGALTAARADPRPARSTSAGAAPGSSTAGSRASPFPWALLLGAAFASLVAVIVGIGALARPRAAARDQHAGVRDRGAGLHLQPADLHRRQHHDRDPARGPRSARAHPPQPRVLLLRACSCSSSCLVLVGAPAAHRHRSHDRRRARERARRLRA